MQLINFKLRCEKEHFEKSVRPALMNSVETSDATVQILSYF